MPLMLTFLSFSNYKGMEKFNDRASKDYFRSTNHRGTNALKQLFLKKNRLQYLEAGGYVRTKSSYTCSNCYNVGHTIKTCTNSCMTCDHPSCCSHLVNSNGKWTLKCKLTLGVSQNCSGQDRANFSKISIFYQIKNVFKS